MKFVSKNANLMIVLRPGIPAQPITGTPAVPTLSVRFHEGLAEIFDDKIIEMMLRHPAFDTDFISVEEASSDPYASMRRPTEPNHVVTEVKFGTPVSRTGTPLKSAMSPELKSFIEDQAKEIARAMLPGMVEATIKAMAENSASNRAAAEEKEPVESTAPGSTENLVDENPKKRGPKPKTV
jgi:hypothetical protein